jgi:hypothetical protein
LVANARAEHDGDEGEPSGGFDVEDVITRAG